MVLSLQAIDFLFASSIHDNSPLSDSDCREEDGVEEGDEVEQGSTVLRIHFSSLGLSGFFVEDDSVCFVSESTLAFVSLLCADVSDVVVGLYFFSSTGGDVLSALFSINAAFLLTDLPQTNCSSVSSTLAALVLPSGAVSWEDGVTTSPVDFRLRVLQGGC